MSRIGAKSYALLLSIPALVAIASPAAAAVSAGQGFEQSLDAVLASFPGGQPLALTAIAIAIGTLVLRVTRLLGLLFTVAVAGVLGAILLMAVEPQMLARLVEAVTRS